jgi:steroid 5-alpha reductase family enzyme
MLGLLMGIALLVSSIGFYRMVYFISVGYAFSITMMAVALVVVGWGRLDLLSLVHNALLLAWGLRLGIFLVQREWRQKSYRRQAEAMHGASAGLNLGVRFLIWITVAALYVALFAPALFAGMGRTPLPGWAVVLQLLGIVGMAGGLAIETVADAQKSAAKQRAPQAFVSTGLYGWVRCPNYLGEMLFWVGNFVAALGFYQGVGAWAISIIGLVCLILIMLGSTRRLEMAQDARYGKDVDYQRYVRATPVIIPYAPVYTVRNLRVYLG